MMVLAMTTIALSGCQRATSCASAKVGGKTFQVELAANSTQRYSGLSNRPAPADGKGMLFVYPSPRMLDFCMRDCSFPLDIIFIGADNKVVQTYTMAVERDRAGRQIYSSRAPAQFALELRSGEVAANGIKPGDEVKFTDIGDPAKAQYSD